MSKKDYDLLDDYIKDKFQIYNILPISTNVSKKYKFVPKADQVNTNSD